MALINTVSLAKHLAARGLVPDHCRLVEVSITPSGPLVLRYEVFVELSQLHLFAEAFKQTADEMTTDDERNRKARLTKAPEDVKP